MFDIVDCEECRSEPHGCSEKNSHQRLWAEVDPATDGRAAMIGACGSMGNVMCESVQEKHLEERGEGILEAFS